MNKELARIHRQMLKQTALLNIIAVNTTAIVFSDISKEDDAQRFMAAIEKIQDITEKEWGES